MSPLKHYGAVIQRGTVLHRRAYGDQSVWYFSRRGREKPQSAVGAFKKDALHIQVGTGVACDGQFGQHQHFGAIVGRSSHCSGDGIYILFGVSQMHCRRCRANPEISMIVHWY